MKNYFRVFTQEVISPKDNKPVLIEVLVDGGDIARQLFRKAVYNKNGVSKIVHGAVVVKVTPRPPVV